MSAYNYSSASQNYIYDSKIIQIHLVILISTLINPMLHRFASFATCFKCLLIEGQKQEYCHKGRNGALQRQDCLWLSAALMCVLDCPLAEAAVTALTFHQKENHSLQQNTPEKSWSCVLQICHIHPLISAACIVWGYSNKRHRNWIQERCKEAHHLNFPEV